MCSGVRDTGSLWLKPETILFLWKRKIPHRRCTVRHDIGTTTVAAYLYDLSSGELLNVRSMMNPQRKFGADVISRIDYAKISAGC